MKLSKDLILYDCCYDVDLCKLYNKYTNTEIVLDKRIYDYLVKSDLENDLKDIYECLTEEQIDILLEENIIFDDFEIYKSKRYIGKSKNKVNNIKTVYIHLTYKCNLKCQYCYQRENLNTEYDIPFKKWKTVLDKFKVEGVSKVIFTGGEPLIYKEVFEIVKYAKTLGFFVDLLTNGTLLKSNLDILNYIDNIIVSLDNLNKSLRYGLNSNETLNTIIDISKSYGNKLIVRSVVSRGLEEDTEKLKKFLESNNIRHISAMRMPNSVDEISLIPDYDSYNLIEIDCINAGCGAGDEIISISPSGDVYPCQVLMKSELKMGNVLEKDFINTIKSSKIYYEVHKFDSYSDEKCKDCELLHFCSGGCPANTYNLYEDFNKRPEFMCDYYLKCGRYMHEREEL